MTTFKPKLEILPGNQRTLWPALKPLGKSGFVLYGGTAIALYLGHRQSVDFDFFTDRAITDDDVRDFPFMDKAVLHHRGANTFIFMIPGKAGDLPVKISFFGNLAFAQKGKIKTTDDGVLRVAPLKYLLATKLKVLFDRVEIKDYIDIASLLEAGLSLEAGLKTAQGIFGNTFAANEAKKALIYFDTPELKNLNERLKTVLEKAVREVEFK